MPAAAILLCWPLRGTCNLSIVEESCLVHVSIYPIVYAQLILHGRVVQAHVLLICVASLWHVLRSGIVRAAMLDRVHGFLMQHLLTSWYTCIRNRSSGSKIANQICGDTSKRRFISAAAALTLGGPKRAAQHASLHIWRVMYRYGSLASFVRNTSYSLQQGNRYMALPPLLQLRRNEAASSPAPREPATRYALKRLWLQALAPTYCASSWCACSNAACIRLLPCTSRMNTCSSASRIAVCFASLWLD